VQDEDDLGVVMAWDISLFIGVWRKRTAENFSLFSQIHYQGRFYPMNAVEGIGYFLTKDKQLVILLLL
jgi:hypothetical protein